MFEYDEPSLEFWALLKTKASNWGSSDKIKQPWICKVTSFQIFFIKSADGSRSSIISRTIIKIARDYILSDHIRL